MLVLLLWWLSRLVLVIIIIIILFLLFRQSVTVGFTHSLTHSRKKNDVKKQKKKIKLLA